MKKIAALLLAVLMLTGCSAESSKTSEPLTPDKVFSGGTPDIDIEGYQRPSSMLSMSAQQIVMNMRIGWNLGYSLESCFSNVIGDYIPDVTPNDCRQSTKHSGVIPQFQKSCSGGSPTAE